MIVIITIIIIIIIIIMIEEETQDLGLVLNHHKSEVICSDPSSRAYLLSLIPDAKLVAPSAATLLGSSVGDSSINSTITEKTHLLRTMGLRLHHLSAQDALILLRHSFAIPKLLHILRTSPCFVSPSLKSYDLELRSIVSIVTNVDLETDGPAWSQASLPVKFGGLGIRSAVQLSSSAFLASTAASLDLVHQILPSRLHVAPSPYLADAEAEWSCDHNQPPPTAPASHRQKSWDLCKVMASSQSLLERTTDSKSRAHLLAATSRYAGAWLDALPVSSLGLRMDDDTVRIAVGLRLGSSLCRPHPCCHCGVLVDHLGTHGLSCRQSEGRHYRHAAINNIVCRAMSAAKIPSRLEPSGLSRSDGKRPDGVSVVPWRNGKLLIWDATSPDTFAPSYSSLASTEAGLVAARAEELKGTKYAPLVPHHIFTPVAIETGGVVGPQSLPFLQELGRRLRQVTGDSKSFVHLLQRLSIAVQQGNAASVLGSINHSLPDEICL